MPRYRRASEIGAFAYCRHAWWLRHGLGLAPGNVEARAEGEAAHSRLGRDVRHASSLHRLALWLFILATAALVLNILR